MTGAKQDRKRDYKRQKLRNAEYYSMLDTLDMLHVQSKDGKKFNKLMDFIVNEKNILLAYRNIKRNTGGSTKGVNGKTISYLANFSTKELVSYVRNRLGFYKPQRVRRIHIPKESGKTSPLGIPTIEDRLIQQCILQILQPICEAKFYNHSYGFRPNRSTQHAISRAMTLMQKVNLHYVVDIDIKGFFDNVNHSKLLKQMWTLGIRDKRLLSIIAAMLRAEIEGEGIPTKGTPQGGILSPLLSNIVLNELGWWIASQWEHMPTRYKYVSTRKNGRHDNTSRFNALKKTSLKQIWMVRYADDFKIFCKDYKNAQKIFIATKRWLGERLELEISPNKSRVVNLRKNYSDFLGYKLKVRPKRKSYTVQSHVSDKAKERITKALRNKVKEIAKGNKNKKGRDINNSIYSFNLLIQGTHNYYRYATHVNLDFDDIAFVVNRIIKNRFLKIAKISRNPDNTYRKFYGNYRGKIYSIRGITLFPIHGVKFKSPRNFTQQISNYTYEGREKIHKALKAGNPQVMKYLLENPVQYQTTEYNDNRLSLYAGQNGKCGVTGQTLEIGDIECHHKLPKELGGNDKYDNLILVTYDVHKLTHATRMQTICYYLNRIKTNKIIINKINKLRISAGKMELVVSTA